MCAFRAVPLLPRLTGSHPLTLQFALKTSAEVQRPIPTFLSLFFTFNGDVLHDLFKWQTSPVSLFLSWGISHWVLMSDYFTSHSALDKWLRRAVKNRSKPLGWERGGRRREAVKSPSLPPPPPPDRPQKMPPIIRVLGLIKASEWLESSSSSFFLHLNKPLSSSHAALPAEIWSTSSHSLHHRPAHKLSYYTLNM